MSTMLRTAFDQIALFDFTLRYQRLPLAKYHVRPLSLLQQDILSRCDGAVTIADLADATLSPILKSAMYSPSESNTAW